MSEATYEEQVMKVLEDTNILEAPPTEGLISIASSGMLVSVEVNVWTATKQDRAISEEVTSSKSAVSDAGKFTKNLLANAPSHKALLNYRQTVYNWLQRMGYDWAGPVRVVPTVDMPRLMKEYYVHEAQFNKHLDEFCVLYPQLVSDMAFKQGSMFSRADYPEVESIRRKFGINLLVTTVPQDDFRNQVAVELAADLKKHYERQVSNKINAIMEDAAGRLVEVATRISNACTDTGVDLEDENAGKVRRKKIYESTVENAKELCVTLKSFNLTKNPALEEARAKLERALSSVTIVDLRESAFTRAAMKEDVDDLLSAFAPIRTTFN